ncbi:MAG: hypothetical protein IJO48_03825 [Clostridia bacterium]|nr:hypothetical protein [Clostridia bacterium]
MKRLIVVFLCVVMLLASACNEMTTMQRLSETLGINAKECQILSNTDSHGGFFGDGLEYVVAQCNSSVAAEIAKSIEWRKLPLSESLVAAIYGVKYENAVIGPYVNMNGVPCFPKVENGYYFFLDRQSEDENSKDETSFLNRPSFNLTFAIYDTDNNTLYYCEYDT